MTQEFEVQVNAFKFAYLVARSGGFETSHEVDGRKVTVTRGPGGQFASPGSSSSFTDRVEDARKFINEAISKNTLESEPVEAFNKAVASQLGDWLGKDAEESYRNAVSGLPDAVIQSEKKLQWATNDVARVVKKLPKAD
jgi:hypothetical protein